MLLCSRSLSLCTTPLHSLGGASASWELVGGAEGWRSTPAAQPAHFASKGNNPLLVCVPPDSRRVLLLCLSCYLCLPFASSSCGRWKRSQPPESRDTSQTLLGQAGNAEHWPGAAAFPGRAGMCSQGSRPALPPSFFIHENSISLGAGQPETSSEVGVPWPPFRQACPHTSGQQTAAPGQFLTGTRRSGCSQRVCEPLLGPPGTDPSHSPSWHRRVWHTLAMPEHTGSPSPTRSK